jgi:hypothetical protein
MLFYQSWLVVSTPLKNMKVSWDDYSQHMESHKIHVPNHQAVIYQRVKVTSGLHPPNGFSTLLPAFVQSHISSAMAAHWS